jgi:hypothetical protein
MLSREVLQSRPSSQKLLARVLEMPELANQVQALPSIVLGKLIEQVGLEDAAELVALATTDQLAQIFDEDLWRSARTGEDERFDSDRFLVWLEVMLEAGERSTAQRLSELPPDLLTLAIHRHVLVMSLDDLQAELTAGDDEADAAEKAFESCLSEELDEYQLIWRGGDGWDSVLTALLALDREHHSLVSDLLERCAALSREHIADNGGLYEVLSSDQMLEQDVAAERETRRTELGHVAPSAAAAFLRLSTRPGACDVPFTQHDSMTRAYFRELPAAPAVKAPKRGKRAAESGRLLRLLQSAGVTGVESPRPRLQPAGSSSQEPLVITALRWLAEQSPEKFRERSEELAYLSNVLLAGCEVNGRRLRPVEAVEHAISCVSVGLALSIREPAPTAARAGLQLTEYPCDGLFRLASSKLGDASLVAKSGVDDRLLTRARSFFGALRV